MVKMSTNSTVPSQSWDIVHALLASISHIWRLHTSRRMLSTRLNVVGSSLMHLLIQHFQNLLYTIGDEYEMTSCDTVLYMWSNYSCDLIWDSLFVVDTVIFDRYVVNDTNKQYRTRQLKIQKPSSKLPILTEIANWIQNAYKMGT